MLKTIVKIGIIILYISYAKTTYIETLIKTHLGVELLEFPAVIVELEPSLIIGALEHRFKGPGAFPGAPSTSIAELDDDIRMPSSIQHLIRF